MEKCSDMKASRAITDGLTRDEALDQLRTVAACVAEADEAEAVERLLERITARAEPALLRDALILEGARQLIRQARGER